MNKDNTTVKKAKKEEKKVDYKAKWKEIKENLVIQHKESIEQIEIHKSRATKILGAIEVNDQLFEEKENSDS